MNRENDAKRNETVEDFENPTELNLQLANVAKD